MHALEDALGVQQAPRQWLRIVGRREAQHVRVEQQPAAHARAERVPIDAQHAGDRPAVRVQGGRRVVRLHLHR